MNVRFATNRFAQQTKRQLSSVSHMRQANGNRIGSATRRVTTP
ncbi:hypothetical protein URH17368_0863 [Alicyclobacillus hesperidum URH17-3-68]|nr:hypothetical protein URH17368_0863 [Alicyclobacillus hesperidum URH17-3-68]